MGRKRRKEDQWMPSRVYRGKSAYEWHPKEGGAIKLCPLNSNKSTVHLRYEQEIAKQKKKDTVAGMFAKYLESPQFESLKTESQNDYTKHTIKLKKVFGNMSPYKVSRKDVIKYRSIRGNQSAHQCNHEIAVFRLIFNWAMNHLHFDLPINPCQGVKKVPTKARDRYIEDWEYELVYKAKHDAVFRGIMEVQYLCGSIRLSDVLALTKDQLLDEGIYFKSSKTGKKHIKAWTPRLRKAIDDALKQHNSKPVVTYSKYVFNTVRGTKYTTSGFGSTWGRHLRKLRKDTGHKLDFTFHDIKAKGTSDFDGNKSEKQEFTTHSDARMVSVYDRKIPIVPALDLPLIK